MIKCQSLSLGNIKIRKEDPYIEQYLETEDHGIQVGYLENNTPTKYHKNRNKKGYPKVRFGKAETQFIGSKIENRIHLLNRIWLNVQNYRKFAVQV